MTLSEDLAWRGLIKDKTFGDLAWLDSPRTFYQGIDASAASLTIGNLAFILLGRRLADGGWKPVLLMGGGTSLVGDPGGKTSERELVSREEVKKNIAGVKAQAAKLFSGENFTLLDNYDWLSGLKYLDFLRDVGKHFSMSELMQREFVTERMGQQGSGISYAEFSYSLIQGYDYWHLYKNHGVELQIGGSDQWGNMLSGVSMIRKKEAKEVQAFSMPLVVNKSTGQKFGKSEAGAVWLDPKLTTPTQFYQFWINTDDADLEDYLKIFTLLSKDEIEQILDRHRQDPAQRSGQKRLAEEVTKIVHGGDDSGSASSLTKYLTSQVSLAKASEAELDELRREIPSLKVKAGTPVIEALVEAKLAKSNSDARRLLESGAVYVNNEKFSDPHLDAKLFNNGRLLLRRGKAYKDSSLIELQ